VNNWKVIFAALIIFGAGVITGGLLVSYVQHCSGKKVHNQPVPVVNAPATNPPAALADPAKPARLPEIMSKRFMQQLDEMLHLTPEQRTAIQKVINERQNQIRRTLQDARLEIRELLTPAQLLEFDELVKHSATRRPSGTNAVVAPPTNAVAIPAKTP
jgi:uncharacterized membrane protein